MARDLTPAELIFIAKYSAGGTAIDAARAAGYAEATAKSSAHRLLARPAIAEAIDEARARLRASMDYDLRAAAEQVEQLIDEARGARQFSAVARLVELKARLFGLLIERSISVHGGIDVVAAMNEGAARIAKGAGLTVIDTASSPINEGLARIAGRHIDGAEIFSD